MERQIPRPLIGTSSRKQVSRKGREDFTCGRPKSPERHPVGMLWRGVRRAAGSVAQRGPVVPSISRGARHHRSPKTKCPGAAPPREAAATACLDADDAVGPEPMTPGVWSPRAGPATRAWPFYCRAAVATELVGSDLEQACARTSGHALPNLSQLLRAQLDKSAFP